MQSTCWHRPPQGGRERRCVCGMEDAPPASSIVSSSLDRCEDIGFFHAPPHPRPAHGRPRSAEDPSPAFSIWTSASSSNGERATDGAARNIDLDASIDDALATTTPARMVRGLQQTVMSNLTGCEVVLDDTGPACYTTDTCAQGKVRRRATAAATPPRPGGHTRGRRPAAIAQLSVRARRSRLY